MTTTANSAIAKRRRNEKKDEDDGTRPTILLTGGPKIGRASRSHDMFAARFTRASLDRKAQAPRQHNALDLAGSFADLEDLGVAVETADWRLVDIAVAAVNLHGVARRVDRDLRRVQLRHGGSFANRTALFAQPRGLVHEVARILDGNGHVGAFERDGLVTADRSSERLALVRIRNRRLEARARHTERQRRDGDAPVVENAQEGLEALTAHAEQLPFGNTATVEHELVRVGRVP